MSEYVKAAELMNFLAQVNPEANVIFVYDGGTTYDSPKKIHYDYSDNTVVLTGN